MEATLSVAQRAWLAGFFDGDGSVFFLDGKYKRPKLVFDQKDPAVLHHIQEMLGYGVLASKKNQHGEYWVLRIVKKAEVYDLARAMQPYSVVKREGLRRAIQNLQRHP